MCLMQLRSMGDKNSSLPGRWLWTPLPCLGREYMRDSNKVAIVTRNMDRDWKATPSDTAPATLMLWQVSSLETQYCHRSSSKTHDISTREPAAHDRDCCMRSPVQ